MSTCPQCGAEVTYEVHEARVLTGTCEDCHRVTTLVEGTLPIGSSAPSSPETGSPGSTSPRTGPECADCGSPLTVTARDDGSLEVACSECDTVTTFVAQGGREAPAPPSRSRRWDRAPGRAEVESDRGPRSRPCRQCGAPLTFSTAEDGTLTGECSSCGNRFTLPPRRDGPGRSGGGFRDRYSRGPPRRYGGSGGRGSDRGAGGSRRFGGSGGRYQRRGRSPEPDDDDRRRRRRE